MQFVKRTACKCALSKSSIRFVTVDFFSVYSQIVDFSGFCNAMQSYQLFGLHIGYDIIKMFSVFIGSIMPTKNNKRLYAINQKIAELQQTKNQLENDFVQDMSEQLARILLKKKIFNFDKTALLKRIEAVVDEI